MPTPASGQHIVIVGSNGQLGTDLLPSLAGHRLIGLTHEQLDITRAAQVKEVLARCNPAMVINTAAYNRVDDCERYPETCFAVNGVGAYNLAVACRDLGAILVHFSTDYVFDGASSAPYAEGDRPCPISAYGISKLAGEQFVQYVLNRHFIIRTTGLFGKAGSRGKGGNFVETMLRVAAEGRPIKVVEDQVLSPTSTQDLAGKVSDLIQTEGFGLYHITNQGSCSWYDFARKIFELSGMAPDLSPTNTEAFGAAARRPRYSVLDNRRLRQSQLGLLRPWEEALQAYLSA